MSKYAKIAKILVYSGVVTQSRGVAALLIKAVKIGGEKIAEKVIRNNVIVDFDHPCGYCQAGECYTYPISFNPQLCYCPGCECLHPRDDHTFGSSGSLMLEYE